jgi:hypothetical protein
MDVAKLEPLTADFILRVGFPVFVATLLLLAVLYALVKGATAMAQIHIALARLNGNIESLLDFWVPERKARAQANAPSSHDRP